MEAENNESPGLREGIVRPAQSCDAVRVEDRGVAVGRRRVHLVPPITTPRLADDGVGAARLAGLDFMWRADDADHRATT